MEKTNIAFLDLLGFSNFTLIDEEGALRLLENYHKILDMKLTDQRIAPADSYGDPRLRNLAKNCQADSFEYFLPFSDSVFITSKKPDLFLKQISCFLFEAFNFTSHTFRDNLDENNISKVIIKVIGYDAEKKVKKFEKVENWYPVLFRGGISYGKIIPVKMTGIEECNQMTISNLLGKALVEGVKLEKTDKGPRLFCNKSFINNLSSDSKHFILPLNKPDLFEVLWPMIIYTDSNDCNIEINSFMDLFIPALNLWKAFNHLEIGIHYYKFIKLVVISTLKYFKYRGCKSLAEKYIDGKIKEYGIEHKRKDLMNSVYI